MSKEINSNLIKNLFLCFIKVFPLIVFIASIIDCVVYSTCKPVSIGFAILTTSLVASAVLIPTLLYGIPKLSLPLTFVHELGHALSALFYKRVLPDDEKVFIEICLCHKFNKNKRGMTFSNIYDECKKCPDKHSRFLRMSALSGMFFVILMSWVIYVLLMALIDFEQSTKILLEIFFSTITVCECYFFTNSKGKLSDKAIFCDPIVFSEYNGDDETEYKYSFTFCINF